VLPSPSSQRFDDEGRLKPNWRNYIDRLMRIAAERDRITQAELERGLEEEVRFGVPASDPWALPESGAEPNIDDLIPF
jgi:hypothetical protein